MGHSAHEAVFGPFLVRFCPVLLGHMGHIGFGGFGLTVAAVYMSHMAGGGGLWITFGVLG
jgi:hypothetical protein